MAEAQTAPPPKTKSRSAPPSVPALQPTLYDAMRKLQNAYSQHWAHEIDGYAKIPGIVADAIRESPMTGPVFEAVDDVVEGTFVPFLGVYKKLRFDTVQQLMQYVVLFYFLQQDQISTCIWRVVEAQKALDTFAQSYKEPLQFSITMRRGMGYNDQAVAVIQAENEAEKRRDAECNALRDKVAEAERQLDVAVADALKCLEGDGTGLQPECIAFREYFSLFMRLVKDMQEAQKAIGDDEKAKHRKTKDALIGQICTGVNAFISHFVEVKPDQ